MLSENLHITWTTLLAFFGALSVIAGGVKVVLQLFTPFKEIRAELSEHKIRLDKHDEFLHNDKGAIAELQAMSRDNALVNLAMLNHWIDGNGTDEMKKLREDIQARLLR